MIDARIVKTFPGFTLDVHLKTGPGITVLFGPSGSGKSSTLNSIAGFTRPDQGRILVRDHLFFDAEAKLDIPPEHRHCGYMFQDDTLFPHMTVRANLRFAATLRGLKGLHMHRRVNDLLEAFELADFADRKPVRLSGGQRQRAALARVLVGDPKILLLDEPTRGLDVRLRQSFYELLRSERRRTGMPILVVTHDLEECFALADAVCLVEAGRFLQSGPVADVVNAPATLEAARFLGLYAITPAEITALDPGRDSSRLRVSGQDIEGPYLRGHLIGDNGYLCVAACEVRVQKPNGKGRELLLEIESAEPCPSGMRLRLSGGLTAIVPGTLYEELRSLPRVAVHIPPRAILFLSR